MALSVKIILLQKKELHICDALRNLLPFVEFKKRQKHPWRSLTFGKVTGFNMQL